MRKRRRLANKMTIMVCSVLIAVSAFFYAPMEVSAEENYQYTLSTEFDLSEQHACFIGTDFGYYNLVSDYTVSDDLLYKTELDFDITFYSSIPVNYMGMLFSYATSQFNPLFYLDAASWVGGELFTEYNHTWNSSFIIRGSDLKNFHLVLHGNVMGLSNEHVDLDFVFSLYVKSLVPLSAEESSDYQNGYNAGYSAGETAGYGNGYSQGFTDGEASVDTGAIYDEAFQAGKDSVDTQSYYDAGYQAGYQVAYSEGYESGYDEGYQSAMDRIGNWGADTADYPLLLLDKPLMSRVFSITVKSSIPTQYSDFAEWTSDLNFNPNHTYRFNVVLNPTEYKEGSTDIYFMNSDIFYLNIGGIKYHISNFSGSNVNTFFVPGDRMSSAFSFSWEPLLAVMGDTFESGSAYCYYDLNYQIYDMGPSGDTQNHIANQTDQLTNGYDDSKGNQVNSDLSIGLNDYETAENSLFATATTGLKDFTFFDFESVPAMITGMSFIGSIMASWFNQAGGASGVGIVLSILFSVILVAMVLGLYRWYQSRGGKN